MGGVKPKGRPSKLTPEQWGEIGRRVAAGESMGALALEFDVSKSNISGRYSQKAERIRIVANKLVDANRALTSLPESERPLAVRLADDLKSISLNLTRAAKAGSATAAHLAELATERSKSIMRTEPKDGMLVDQGVRSDVFDLSIAANRAAAPALRLLVVSQGRDLPAEDLEDEGGLATLSDKDLDEILAIHERAGGK